MRSLMVNRTAVAVALCALASLARAESLPESVQRLDRELRALREEVDRLRKAPGSAQAEPTRAVIIKKTELTDWRLGEVGNATVEKARMMDRIASNCRFIAAGARVDSKPHDFNFMLRVSLPWGESASVVEVDSFISCPSSPLLRALELPSTLPGIPMPTEIKARCGGAEALRGTGPTDYLLVPVIGEQLLRASYEQILDGSWPCSLRFVRAPS